LENLGKNLEKLWAKEDKWKKENEFCVKKEEELGVERVNIEWKRRKEYGNFG